MTPSERRAIARRVMVRVSPGDGAEKRIVEVRDFGIGLAPEEMPQTILSLNEGNKLRKPYLVGVYGQGGSSTLALSTYVLIASRKDPAGPVGFTVEEYQLIAGTKTGHYVYLTLSGSVLGISLSPDEFPVGTAVRHYGYDLSKYKGHVGPRSVYGLLNGTLFAPVLPVWLDDEVHDYRRVIKGSRNSLNGARDEDDPRTAIVWSIPMYYVDIGSFGRIGLEYWVTEPPTGTNKHPTAVFVNPSRPIVLTKYGQTHAEMSRELIKEETEFPFLYSRLICHVDCSWLTHEADRALFVSNREDARRGAVYDTIKRELLSLLKSDDELARINAQGREQALRKDDESTGKEIRMEVARLLKTRGITLGPPIGATVGGNEGGTPQITHPRRSYAQPAAIEVKDPPTFVRIVVAKGGHLTFYPSQRRYVRIETDASDTYFDPVATGTNRLNVIVTARGLVNRGATALRGGRTRVLVEADPKVNVGDIGILRVELMRPGLPVLSDECLTEVVETPPALPAQHRVSIPEIRLEPVELEGPLWLQLGWPDDPRTVAFSYQMASGWLTIYYSTVYPPFRNQRAKWERQDLALAESFTRKYGVWLAVHSLLMDEGREGAIQAVPPVERATTDTQMELTRVCEEAERCRAAHMAVLFADSQLAEALAAATLTAVV